MWAVLFPFKGVSVVCPAWGYWSEKTSFYFITPSDWHLDSRHTWMSVCASNLRIIAPNTHTKRHTLFYCSGLQRDIVLWYWAFFPPSIYFEGRAPSAHQSHHDLSDSLPICLSHTRSLSGPRLCTNHAQTKTHLCKSVLWEGFNIFFDHCSSDSKSAPKQCSETLVIYLFDIEVPDFNILIILIFLWPFIYLSFII